MFKVYETLALFLNADETDAICIVRAKSWGGLDTRRVLRNRGKNVATQFE